MIAMDAPRRTTLPLLVNKAFMPRTVARIEADVRDTARRMRMPCEFTPVG